MTEMARSTAEEAAEEVEGVGVLLSASSLTGLFMLLDTLVAVLVVDSAEGWIG